MFLTLRPFLFAPLDGPARGPCALSPWPDDTQARGPGRDQRDAVHSRLLCRPGLGETAAAAGFCGGGLVAPKNEGEQQREACIVLYCIVCVFVVSGGGRGGRSTAAGRLGVDLKVLHGALHAGGDRGAVGVVVLVLGRALFVVHLVLHLAAGVCRGGGGREGERWEGK